MNTILLAQINGTTLGNHKKPSATTTRNGYIYIYIYIYKTINLIETFSLLQIWSPNFFFSTNDIICNNRLASNAKEEGNSVLNSIRD